MIHIILPIVCLILMWTIGILWDKTGWIPDRLFMPIIWGLWVIVMLNWMVAIVIQ